MCSPWAGSKTTGVPWGKAFLKGTAQSCGIVVEKYQEGSQKSETLNRLDNNHFSGGKGDEICRAAILREYWRHSKYNYSDGEFRKPVKIYHGKGGKWRLVTSGLAG